MNLSGKTALVTGAAGAIGAAIADSLIRQGAGSSARGPMWCCWTAPLSALAQTLGPQALALVLDLSDVTGLRAGMAGLLSRVGHIDILVNNAGLLTGTKAAETSSEDWRRIMAVNLDAAFLLTQAVLPGMRASRWRRIINMSFDAARSGGLTAGTAYAVSSTAMIGLTYAIARETTADGITVNAVAPAYVMTSMISEQLTAAQRAAHLSQIPTGRFCAPQEVAHAVAFLTDPLAGYITGTVIDMNGGLQFG